MKKYIKALESVGRVVICMKENKQKKIYFVKNILVHFFHLISPCKFIIFQIKSPADTLFDINI